MIFYVPDKTALPRIDHPPRNLVWFGRSYLQGNLSLFFGVTDSANGVDYRPWFDIRLRTNQYLFMSICDKEDVQGRPTKDPWKGRVHTHEEVP